MLNYAHACAHVHAHQPCGRHAIYSHSKDIYRRWQFYSQTTGERESSEELACVNFLWCFTSVKNLIRKLFHKYTAIIYPQIFLTEKIFSVLQYMDCFCTHTLCIQTQTLVMVPVVSSPGPSWGTGEGRAWDEAMVQVDSYR